MSGALAALQETSSTYLTVVVANIGGGIFGFDTGGGTVNGLSTAQSPPLRTTTISLLRSNTGGVILELQLFGVVTSSFFKRVAVQATSGTRTVLLASDATFSNPGGTSSFWSWAGTAAWDATGTRIVEVQF